MIVYKITNKINGKAYIGQTIRSLEERLRYHCYDNSGCLAIKSAIDKYGIENFAIEKIFEAESLEELNKKESEFINDLNTLAPNGYNLKTGGEAPRFSEESRAKMSVSRKSYKQSEESNKKGAKTRTGKGNWAFGLKFSQDHCDKLSVAHKGNCSRPKIKVFCKELNKTYDSVSEAAKELKISVPYLSQILNKKRKGLKHYTLSKVL